MNRKAWLVLALLMAAGVSAYAWVRQATREPDAQAASPPAATAPPTVTVEQRATPPVPPAADMPAQMSPDNAARWIADVNSEDAARRAAAINALADVPSATALPILQNVLTSGETGIDRPLAMKALRTLALREGDVNGAIRNVLREVVYHADEGVAQQAQSVLDDLESRLSSPVT